LAEVATTPKIFTPPQPLALLLRAPRAAT